MGSLPAPVLLALVCPSSASYVRETAGGKTEVKPHLLDEGDELWVELRHQHLVDVFNCLGRKGQELGKSKAAQQSQRKGEGGGEGSEGGGGGECVCCGTGAWVCAMYRFGQQTEEVMLGQCPQAAALGMTCCCVIQGGLDKATAAARLTWTA